MDPEIEMTSAAEASENEVTSGAKGPEIEVTSAADGPEIEVTSAADGPEIGGTSSAECQEAEVRRYWSHDSRSSLNSIFRAPGYIRYGRESNFEPKLVSIGPYHHGRVNLHPMEDTKVRCMSDLLKLRNDFDIFFEGVSSNIDRVPVDPFMKFEWRARSFYKEKFDQISDVKFVKTLLRDSCFIIRTMLSFYGDVPESWGFLEVNIKKVRSDLLLLENQIPLFFINVVCFWLFPKMENDYFIRVLLRFIYLESPWVHDGSNCLDFESDHLLDFYWKTSLPGEVPLIEITNFSRHAHRANWAQFPCSVPKLIANATSLHKIAGIKFENKYYSGLRVEFSKGIMRMHCLKIDSGLVTLVVNLIAFENSIQMSYRFISTYIKFMDDLIDSDKDVELLQEFGVIYNTLSSHTEAATLFNDIGNLCLVNRIPDAFFDLFVNVKKYYRSYWNRSWASLRQNYFNSPWAGISVFAGAILLFLSAVQTYCTVFPKK